MSSFEPHFQHRQSAHCESGVMASLLSHAGLPMSEPMAFGLASGLAFGVIFERTRNLVAPSVVHIVVNSTG